MNGYNSQQRTQRALNVPHWHNITHGQLFVIRLNKALNYLTAMFTFAQPYYYDQMTDRSVHNDIVELRTQLTPATVTQTVCSVCSYTYLQYAHKLLGVFTAALIAVLIDILE